MTEDTSQAEFEVVPDGAGFGVRRVGEPQPISHHETREEAEAAARAHSDQGQEVDARKDIFASEGADDATSPKRTFTAVALFAVTVVILIVVVALIVA